MDGFTTFITVVEEWAWVGWLVLIALFLVIEMLTLDLTFLMLSFGSILGLLTDLVGVPVWAQVIIAAVAAASFILFLRPPLLHRLRNGEDDTPSNMDALLDLQGTVLQDVTSSSGQVKLSNGDTWTARSLDDTPIRAGSHIAVVEISGATAIVHPVTEEDF